jgi:hypothetical protein
VSSGQGMGMEKDIHSEIGSIEVGDRAEFKKRKMVEKKEREKN